MIIDGKELAKKYLVSIKDDFSKIDKKSRISLIYFDDINATHLYIRNIKKVSTEIGIDYMEKIFNIESSQEDVIDYIEKQNADDSIDFIFITSEVPSHIDFNELVKHIDYRKDVDCATPHNLGLFYMGNGNVAPCTANGIINILKMQFGDNYIRGKNCVVIGRSNTVGKPVSTLLLNNNGTVSVCHSATTDLMKYTKKADILVVAVGIEKFVTRDMVNDNVVIIDVGINIDKNGKVCGDTNFDELKDYVSAITPVPGGLGQMTVAMFFANCLNLLNNRGLGNS